MTWPQAAWVAVQHPVFWLLWAWLWVLYGGGFVVLLTRFHIKPSEAWQTYYSPLFWWVGVPGALMWVYLIHDRGLPLMKG